jgi:hypothetical protein
MNREHVGKPGDELRRQAERHTASPQFVVEPSAGSFIREPPRELSSTLMHGDLGTSAPSRFLIPDVRMDEMIQLWRDAYGEKLARATARQRAARLLDLYRVLMRRPSHPSEALPKASSASVDG